MARPDCFGHPGPVEPCRSCGCRVACWIRHADTASVHFLPVPRVATPDKVEGAKFTTNAPRKPKPR